MFGHHHPSLHANDAIIYFIMNTIIVVAMRQKNESKNKTNVFAYCCFVKVDNKG